MDRTIWLTCRPCAGAMLIISVSYPIYFVVKTNLKVLKIIIILNNKIFKFLSFLVLFLVNVRTSTWWPSGLRRWI
nr:hypothetical protein Cry52Nrm2_p042 [Cryptomonas curvata]